MKFCLIRYSFQFFSGDDRASLENCSLRCNSAARFCATLIFVIIAYIWICYPLNMQCVRKQQNNSLKVGDRRSEMERQCSSLKSCKELPGTINKFNILRNAAKWVSYRQQQNPCSKLYSFKKGLINSSYKVILLTYNVGFHIYYGFLLINVTECH